MARNQCLALTSVKLPTNDSLWKAEKLSIQQLDSQARDRFRRQLNSVALLAWAVLKVCAPLGATQLCLNHSLGFFLFGTVAQGLWAVGPKA